MQPTVSIDRQQMMEFESTIARTIVQGKKSVSGAMIQASVFASQSAAKATPQAKKNRKSKRYRAKRVFGSRSRAKKDIPWWSMGSVDIWSKGKMETKHFRKDSTFFAAKAIPRRGLAKNVWRATAAKKAARMASNSGLARKYSNTSISKTQDMISRIVMTNSLEYISRAAPRSAAEGVKNANNRMQGILDRKIARDIEKAFQKRMRG